MSTSGPVFENESFAQTEQEDPLLTRNPLHSRKQLQVDLASLRGDSGAQQEMLKPPKQWRG